MKLSPSAHRTSRLRQGFTLPEFSLAAGLTGVLAVIVFTVLRSGFLLSSQNVQLNVSGKNARQMVDRIGDATRYSIAQPTLITKDGVEVTGSAASADGLLVERYIGYPYVIKETGGTTADIPATAKSFVIEYREDLPSPQVGDWFLIETVARPELEIASVTTLTSSVTKILRRRITTVQAINEVARPDTYRVSGMLFRKEAYTFAALDTSASPRFEFRHYPRVTSGTNFTQAANYKVLSTGFRRWQSTGFFTNVTGTANASTLLKAMVYAGKDTVRVENGKTSSTFSSMPIQVKLWSLSK